MPVHFSGLSETILDAVGDTPLLNVEVQQKHSPVVRIM